MIEKKGLTDKEIQELINKEIEWDKEFREVYLPMHIRSKELMKMIRSMKKEVKNGKNN